MKPKKEKNPKLLQLLRKIVTVHMKYSIYLSVTVDYRILFKLTMHETVFLINTIKKLWRASLFIKQTNQNDGKYWRMKIVKLKLLQGNVYNDTIN